MIRTLLARNLRHHLGLLLALCLGMALLEALIVWIAGQIETGPGIRALLEQLVPAGMRQFFGAQFGLVSFAGAVGFGFQHPIALTGTMAFMIVAATIPAGERESGFLDLVMARPLPRMRYFLAVLLLLVLGAVILPLALMCGLCAGLGLADAPGEISWTRYAPSAAGLACLLLAVGGYTALVTAFAHRRGAAAAQAAGLTLFFFWLDITAEMWDPLQSISWLSPFHYFEPVKAAITGSAPVEHFLVLLGISAATSALALLRFQRRDL